VVPAPNRSRLHRHRSSPLKGGDQLTLHGERRASSSNWSRSHRNQEWLQGKIEGRAQHALRCRVATGNVGVISGRAATGALSTAITRCFSATSIRFLQIIPHQCNTFKSAVSFSSLAIEGVTEFLDAAQARNLRDTTIFCCPPRSAVLPLLALLIQLNMFSWCDSRIQSAVQALDGAIP